MTGIKLYYTDEHKNKRLIIEDDDIMKICAAADADAKRKFILLKNLQLKNMNPERYLFMNTDGKETGYSIEDCD